MLQQDSPRQQIIRSLLFFAVLVPTLLAWRADVLPETVADVVQETTDKSPNEVDVQLVTRGYYEELTDLDRGLWERGAGFQAALSLFKNQEGREEGNWMAITNVKGATRSLEGFLPSELMPDVDVLHAGVRVRTNRWGQRDRDYEMQKPAGTFRIAIIGGSNTMGKGIDVEYIYPELVEDRLNEELAGSAYDRYEVINFSMSAYHLLDRVYVTDQKVPAFEPDLILVVATRQDLRWAIHHTLARRIAEGRDLPFDFLREIAEEAGARHGESQVKLRQRLKRFREPLLVGCFRELRRVSEELGVPVVVLNVRLMVNEIHELMDRQAVLADQEGLIAMRIYEAYEGQSPEEMYIRPNDFHPSQKGHQRLADNVYTELMAHPTLRAMLLGETPASEENPSG